MTNTTEYSKAYYRANKEKISAQKKEYYQKYVKPFNKAMKEKQPINVCK